MDFENAPKEQLRLRNLILQRRRLLACGLNCGFQQNLFARMEHEIVNKL